MQRLLQNEQPNKQMNLYEICIINYADVNTSVEVLKLRTFKYIDNNNNNKVFFGFSTSSLL